MEARVCSRQERSQRGGKLSVERKTAAACDKSANSTRRRRMEPGNGGRPGTEPKRGEGEEETERVRIVRGEEAAGDESGRQT